MNSKIKLLTSSLEKQKTIHAKFSSDIAIANNKILKQKADYGQADINLCHSQVDDRESGIGESLKTKKLIEKKEEQKEKIDDSEKSIKAIIENRVMTEKEIARLEREIEIEQYPLRMDTLFKAANVNTYDELLAFIKSKNNTTASE